jgi:hypothetical protein
MCVLVIVDDAFVAVAMETAVAPLSMHVLHWPMPVMHLSNNTWLPRHIYLHPSLASFIFCMPNLKR